MFRVRRQGSRVPGADGGARAGRRAILATATVAALLGLAGCGGGDGGSGGGAPTTTTATSSAPGRTLRVPQDFRTIQRAVTASRPGDLVLVGAGVHREAVEVGPSHARIVIRGVDRNRTILDGHDELGDGIAIHADGVAVENLTVRNYAVNGVVWSPRAGYGTGTGSSVSSYEDRTVKPLQGWRGSYITAYDNGLYGVYAFGSQHGRFDHVYASGHPDSGIYVGRCKPCSALVRDNVAEHNHVGFEGTNAGGSVTVVRNTLSHNRVGVQINSLLKEQAAPQIGSLVAGNRIEDNDDAKAPRGSRGFGAGIVIAGGRQNVVRDNLITGNPRVGVVVSDSPDFTGDDNRVQDNVLRGNGLDLGLTVAGSTSNRNCFTGNRPAGTSPTGLERTTRCGQAVRVRAGTLPRVAVPEQVDYRDVPAPPRQPSMPGATTARATPAVGLPERIDEQAIRVPGATR